jgi:hypothetical protein
MNDVPTFRSMMASTQAVADAIAAGEYLVVSAICGSARNSASVK